MIDPRKLHDFLSHLSAEMQSKKETVLVDELQRAMKHFLFPLTSEFYGVSMHALQKALSAGSGVLSVDDKERAAHFIDEIRSRWFKSRC